MSYFMVKGCSTLFDDLESANKKALEIANQKLSESLFTFLEKEESYEDYDLFQNEYVTQTSIVKVPVLKTINSAQELKDLALEFDFVVSTYVEELFLKEELVQQ